MELTDIIIRSPYSLCSIYLRGSINPKSTVGPWHDASVQGANGTHGRRECQTSGLNLLGLFYAGLLLRDLEFRV